MAKPRPSAPWNPWRRRTLTFHPDSIREWVTLAAWEGLMGAAVCSAIVFGTSLVVNAPRNVVTVFDFTKCYAVPPIVQPCERVAYRTGMMNVMLDAWLGLLLIAVAVVLLWTLWTAVPPKPITDEFLNLLDHSFGRDWRRPRTWPWGRIAWAYGFTLAGACAAFGVGMLVSTAMSSSRPTHAPRMHVETSERFRPVP